MHRAIGLTDTIGVIQLAYLTQTIILTLTYTDLTDPRSLTLNSNLSLF